MIRIEKCLLPVLLFLVAYRVAESHADYASGLVALQTGNYAKAYTEFLPHLRKGDAFAQLVFGYLTRIGRGVRLTDPNGSAKLILKAANQGNAEAQYIIASYYFRGFGRKRDRKAALGWFRKAAENGHSGAQVEMGREYSQADATADDHCKAFEWYRAAARQGHVTGQVMVGDGYAEGKGVAQNLAMALYYYTQAAKQDYGVAYARIAKTFEFGNGVPANAEKAYFWYSVAASRSKGYASELFAKDRSRVESKVTRARRSEIERRVSRLDLSSIEAEFPAVPITAGALPSMGDTKSNGEARRAVPKLRPDNDYAVRHRYFSVAPGVR